MSCRREFLLNSLLVPAGILMNSKVNGDYAFGAKAKKAPAKVSFMSGTDRRQLIYDVLKPFEKEIKKGIKGKRVIIKTNCVWDGNLLCATHPDAIRGVLDFMKNLTDETIVIGESTASPKGTGFVFEEYGYCPLEKEYKAKLQDLNLLGYKTEWILSEKKHALDIKIIDAFLDPKNYFISLARMKSHNCVVATLSLKNMLLSAPLNLNEKQAGYISNQFEKAKMHQGGPIGINYNMFLLSQKVKPDLAIIDGFEGMEGNGPTDGTPVEHGIAVAGTDAVAVDRVGIELMGIKYEDVGYLQWCANAGIGEGDIQKINISGPELKDHIIKYKMNDNIDWQMKWKEQTKS